MPALKVPFCVINGNPDGRSNPPNPPTGTPWAPSKAPDSEWQWVKTEIAETKIQKSIYSENGDPARSWALARLVCGVAPRAECVPGNRNCFWNFSKVKLPEESTPKKGTQFKNR
jgi:hypothetical protein